MADYYHLEDEDRFALMLAAWFHDTGYSGGKAMGHENVSIEIATKFLNEHKVSQQVINKVTGCITATRLPQNPTTLSNKSFAMRISFTWAPAILRKKINCFAKN